MVATQLSSKYNFNHRNNHIVLLSEGGSKTTVSSFHGPDYGFNINSIFACQLLSKHIESLYLSIEPYRL
jgi:hypothetical protein